MNALPSIQFKIFSVAHPNIPGQKRCNFAARLFGLNREVGDWPRQLMCPNGIAMIVLVAAALSAVSVLAVVRAARSHIVQAAFSHAPSATGNFAAAA